MRDMDGRLLEKDLVQRRGRVTGLFTDNKASRLFLDCGSWTGYHHEDREHYAFFTKPGMRGPESRFVNLVLPEHVMGQEVIVTSIDWCARTDREDGYDWHRYRCTTVDIPDLDESYSAQDRPEQIHECNYIAQATLEGVLADVHDGRRRDISYNRKTRLTINTEEGPKSVIIYLPAKEVRESGLRDIRGRNVSFRTILANQAPFSFQPDMWQDVTDLSSGAVYSFRPDIFGGEDFFDKTAEEIQNW